MRSFEYIFEGSEVTIKIFSEDSALICEAKFPTLANSLTYAVQDANWHLGNHSQPALSAEEETTLISLVTEKVNSYE